MAVNADQNGRKNAGKTNCGNEDLVYSCNCDQGEQKKATPKVDKF